MWWGGVAGEGGCEVGGGGEWANRQLNVKRLFSASV